MANAIYDAVGIRLREAPFTPERVLAASARASGKQADEHDEASIRLPPANCASTADRCGSKATGRCAIRGTRRGRASGQPRRGDDEPARIQASASHARSKMRSRNWRSTPGEIQIVAGGTDLLPSMKQGCSRRSMCWTSAASKSCAAFVHSGTRHEIGALATLTAIEDSEFIRSSIRCCMRRSRRWRRRFCATWARSAAISAWTRAASGTTSR